MVNIENVASENTEENLVEQLHNDLSGLVHSQSCIQVMKSSEGIKMVENKNVNVHTPTISDYDHLTEIQSVL